MMNISRRKWFEYMKVIAALPFATSLAQAFSGSKFHEYEWGKKGFENDFAWGASASAFQTEGAMNEEGKVLSVWDTFTSKKGKIRNGDNAQIATDFYHRYPTDISLLKSMNFKHFRFSIAWSRIIVDKSGTVNQKGLDYYKRLIDNCLENGITPWATLYHWDHPQFVENDGGWLNRDIVNQFSQYASITTQALGDRLKNWMVLNEPMSFTGLGYIRGIHAPGRRKLSNLFPVVHHVTMTQAEGGRIIRANVIDSKIGTTYSMSDVQPVSNKEKDVEAAKRVDALLNRMYLEPTMGMGYPTETLPILRKIEKFVKSGDMEKLSFDFDFVGIQYYFRVVAEHSAWIPYLHAREISPKKRNVLMNTMNLEIYPKGIYNLLNKLNKYPKIPPIYITESGVCLQDIPDETGFVNDIERINYFKKTFEYLEKAKNDGANLKGFFVWSLTDNFEWNEGYHPTFGLVSVNYNNQQRIMKKSGLWFQEFLKNTQ